MWMNKENSDYYGNKYKNLIIIKRTQHSTDIFINDLQKNWNK